MNAVAAGPLRAGEESGSRPVPAVARRRTPRRGIVVALVGPDGSGKSTVSRLLESAELPAPVKRVYMGVNLEASTLMLPTTRLLLAVKRRRGGRPDLVASPVGEAAAGGGAAPRRLLWQLARLAVWSTEEWLRQVVVAAYRARGFVVVLDRHFLADYYHADVAPPAGRRSLSSRLHGYVLRRWYPTPDLMVYLDAPAEVLVRRKSEAGVAWLARRRQEYLALGDVLPAFVVVDADRDLSAVVAEVAQLVRDRLAGVEEAR